LVWVGTNPAQEQWTLHYSFAGTVEAGKKKRKANLAVRATSLLTIAHNGAMWRQVVVAAIFLILCAKAQVFVFSFSFSVFVFVFCPLLFLSFLFLPFPVLFIFSSYPFPSFFSPLFFFFFFFISVSVSFLSFFSIFLRPHLLSSSRPLVFIRGKGGERATLPSVHS
jgi:hypothetical protein